MKELDSVVLTRDLPKHGLKEGDIGTIVLVHSAGAGYEVEFIALDGETMAVISLPTEEVRSVARREIPHARQIAI